MMMLKHLMLAALVTVLQATDSTHKLGVQALLSRDYADFIDRLKIENPHWYENTKEMATRSMRGVVQKREKEEFVKALYERFNVKSKFNCGFTEAQLGRWWLDQNRRNNKKADKFFVVQREDDNSANWVTARATNRFRQRQRPASAKIYVQCFKESGKKKVRWIHYADLRRAIRSWWCFFHDGFEGLTMLREPKWNCEFGINVTDMIRKETPRGPYIRFHTKKTIAHHRRWTFFEQDGNYTSLDRFESARLISSTNQCEKFIRNSGYGKQSTTTKGK